MILFRNATIEDAKLLFDWRNCPQTRMCSFDPSELKWDDHLRWLGEKLNGPSAYIFILSDPENVPVGQVRFDLMAKSVAVVDISMDLKYRRRGLAVEGLKLTCPHLIKEKGIERILAYIKKDNTASYRSFKKAGFQDIGETHVKSFDCYALELR